MDLIPNTTTTQIDINQIEISEITQTNSDPYNKADYLNKDDLADTYGNLPERQTKQRRHYASATFGQAENENDKSPEELDHYDGT